MPGVISEKPESRSFTIGTQTVRELIYNIVGTDSETEAEALLDAEAPPVYGGLERDSINADPQGGGYWRGYARYIRPEDADEFTFDTGGGTTKKMQSLATTAYPLPGTTAPDFDGAIGVSEDAVAGVDITTPVYQWTETHKFADGSVDAAYRLAIFNATGCVNDGTFRGFAAGVVLFLGASGSQRADAQWIITFRFAAQPNQTGLAIGSITGISRLGWDHIWARYGDFEDAPAKALVKRPIAIYVETVYPTADYSTLNIGTT